MKYTRNTGKYKERRESLHFPQPRNKRLDWWPVEQSVFVYVHVSLGACKCVYLTSAFFSHAVIYFWYRYVSVHFLLGVFNLKYASEPGHGVYADVCALLSSDCSVSGSLCKISPPSESRAFAATPCFRVAGVADWATALHVRTTHRRLIRAAGPAVGGGSAAGLV